MSEQLWSGGVNTEPVDPLPVLALLPGMATALISQIPNADSYRLSVAGAIIIEPGDQQGHIVMSTENQKPLQGDQIVNYCTERKNFAAAVGGRTGERWGVAIGQITASTASKSEIRSVNDERAETLLNCNKCLQAITYRQAEDIIGFSDEVPCISLRINPKTDKIDALQVFSHAELMQLRINRARFVGGVSLSTAFLDVGPETLRVAAEIAHADDVFLQSLPAARAIRYAIRKANTLAA